MALGDLIEVGRVAELWVYPVKSMKGVQMDEVSLRSVSVVGDRRIAFHYADTTRVPSALDSIHCPELLLYSPYFVDPSNPGESKILVRTPDNRHLSADNDELLEEIAKKVGKELVRVSLGRASYHSMPVSVATLSSIRKNGEEAGLEPDPRRFRENVLVKTIRDNPYPRIPPNTEMNWVGCIVFLGREEDSAKIVALKPDLRCKTVGYNPDTLDYTSAFEEATIKNHQHFLGVYGSVAKEGKIRIGDRVYISRL